MNLKPFHALVISMCFTVICFIVVVIHVDLRISKDSIEKIEKPKSGVDTLKSNN